jgi:hypothetical protein
LIIFGAMAVNICEEIYLPIIVWKTKSNRNGIRVNHNLKFTQSLHKRNTTII